MVWSLAPELTLQQFWVISKYNSPIFIVVYEIFGLTRPPGFTRQGDTLGGARLSCPVGVARLTGGG